MADKRICSIQQCGNIPHAKGLCNSHYRIWLRESRGEVCSVADCENPFYASGLCSRHYARHRRHGDALAGGVSPGEAQKFYNDTVLQYLSDGCLMWPFARDEKGYGVIRFNGKRQLVHRLLCALECGPPPTEEHVAAHRCGNGSLGCVNRKHLRWATPQENSDDMIIHGSRLYGEALPQAKLTSDQVLRIRTMSEHMMQKDIAHIFGITKAHVSEIVNKKKWKWLE